MTPKERAAMQQALEALEVYEIKLNSRLCNEAITALREALDNTRSSIRSTSEYSEQAEQEPVGVVRWFERQSFGLNTEMVCDAELEVDLPEGTKLYAAPVRTKDLTDEEIMKINVDTASIVPTCDRQFHFARAVIAADREKNK
jgi:hypothetical protein